MNKKRRIKQTDADAGLDYGDKYAHIKEAVVVHAVRDYEKALRRLMAEPNDIHAGKTKIECEQFFRSARFAGFCAVDGEAIIKRVKERVGWKQRNTYRRRIS